VTWKEVEDCLKKEDPELLVFTSDEVLSRADKHGDLFEPVLTLKQKLPQVAVLAEAGTSSRTRVAAPKTGTRKKQAKRKVG
jgi:bifunctional non-homologous end joining protein LigD